MKNQVNIPNTFQLRWKPFDIPLKTFKSVDWVDGLRTIAGAGDPRQVNGVGIHIYACNVSMQNKCGYLILNILQIKSFKYFV